MAARLADWMWGRRPAQRRRHEKLRKHPWLTGTFAGVVWMVLFGAVTGVSGSGFVMLPVAGFIYGLWMALFVRWYRPK